MLELRNLVSRVEDLRMMVGRVQTDQSEPKTSYQYDEDPHFQYVTQAARVAQIHEGWQNKGNQIVYKEAALARLDGFDHSVEEGRLVKLPSMIWILTNGYYLFTNSPMNMNE